MDILEAAAKSFEKLLNVKYEVILVKKKVFVDNSNEDIIFIDKLTPKKL